MGLRFGFNFGFCETVAAPLIQSTWLLGEDGQPLLKEDGQPFELE